MRFSDMVFRSLAARMESMTLIYLSRTSGGTVAWDISNTGARGQELGAVERLT